MDVPQLKVANLLIAICYGKHVNTAGNHERRQHANSEATDGAKIRKTSRELLGRIPARADTKKVLFYLFLRHSGSRIRHNQKPVCGVPLDNDVSPLISIRLRVVGEQSLQSDRV